MVIECSGLTTKLSSDQEELLNHISHGLSNKAIADIYNCPLQTIKRRVSSLMSQTNSSNRVSLAVKYILASYSDNRIVAGIN